LSREVARNLDCEAAWAGATLPALVRRRISLYAALFAACAPPDDGGEPHELWAPAGDRSGAAGRAPRVDAAAGPAARRR